MLKRLFTTRNLIIVVLFAALFFLSSRLGLQVPTPEVSVAAEPILHIGPLTITNSLLTTWIAMLVLIVISWLATRRIPRDISTASNAELAPSGFQSAIEWMIEGFYGMSKEIAGSWTGRFFPIVMSIFLLVVVSNWLGLIPGVGSIGILEPAHNGAGLVANGAILTSQEAEAGQGYILIPLFRSPSADLNLTVALALVAVVLTQYWGIKAAKGGYFKRFFDVSGFKNGALVGIAQAFAGLLELVGEFTKIISFSFRLFGNIFAGEVLLAVLAFLIPYVVSLPFYGLELFVGFIQAFVFMMLTLVFFANATAVHGSDSEQHHVG